MSREVTELQRKAERIPFYQPRHHEVDLFDYAWRNQLPVLLKGPTGCGKTRFIEHMAARLGRPLYTVACHDDLTAADLVGRHLIGDGATYWHDGPLTRAVREGAICYLDEVVEARKDTTVVLHPLSDDRRMLPIERSGETLHAPPEFMLVVSYNPGYQNLLKGMKPSTRQRFVSMRFDFPGAQQECDIVVRETGIDAPTAARLMHDGFDAMEACRAALIEPLSDDEATVDALMEVVRANFG